ncbi:Glucosaminyl phosphatidylinositol (GlcN-PI) nositol acylation protein [Orbilia javanica]|uniref:GPI-anchored wall transfer protein n=1 Tax=Orbilia javanica TaxID=47235 RepID=A0AAN8MTA1_9PEZI
MEVTPEQAAAAKIYQSLKDNKEAFYSNLTGGSIAEINFVTSVAPIAYFIYAALQTRKGFFQSDEYSLPLFLIDFGLNAAALLLSITVYSQYAIYFSLFLALNGCVLYFTQSPLTQSKQRKPPPPKDDAAKELSEKEKLDVYLPKKAFITAWRGGMMMVTCLAILAVDFPVFPRRFAKVETWGQSLMDLGVGSFVFANGVATARSVLRDAHLGKVAPLATRLKRSLRSSLALLALGLVRLFLTKTADYHEHITEYGLHWNFFMTLGCLPPFVALFQGTFVKMAFPELLAICTGAGYQLVLFNYGLQNWVLLAERTNIINANKEGIASFFGYLAIFLAGQATGMRILPLQQTQTQSQSKQPQGKQSQGISKKKTSTQSAAKKPLLKPLLLQAIVWTMLYQLTDNYKYGMINTQISRRIANMPYLCWVAAFNCWQLLAFYLIETVCWGDSESTGGKSGSVATYEERSPRLLRAFNRNGLIIFLVANIATGLVNMTMNTIETKTPVSMGVLFAYTFGLSSLAVGLDLKNITIKL